MSKEIALRLHPQELFVLCGVIMDSVELQSIQIIERITYCGDFLTQRLQITANPVKTGKYIMR